MYFIFGVFIDSATGVIEDLLEADGGVVEPAHLHEVQVVLDLLVVEAVGEHDLVLLVQGLQDVEALPVELLVVVQEDLCLRGVLEALLDEFHDLVGLGVGVVGEVLELGVEAGGPTEGAPVLDEGSLPRVVLALAGVVRTVQHRLVLRRYHRLARVHLLHLDLLPRVLEAILRLLQVERKVLHSRLVRLLLSPNIDTVPLPISPSKRRSSSSAAL